MRNQIELEIFVRKLVTISAAEYNLIAECARHSQATTLKVVLIKFIRAQYAIGLKEAKDIVDAVVEREHGKQAATQASRPDMCHEPDLMKEFDSAAGIETTSSLGELLRRKLDN